MSHPDPPPHQDHELIVAAHRSQVRCSWSCVSRLEAKRISSGRFVPWTARTVVQRVLRCALQWPLASQRSSRSSRHVFAQQGHDADVSVVVTTEAAAGNVFV